MYQHEGASIEVPTVRFHGRGNFRRKAQVGNLNWDMHCEINFINRLGTGYFRDRSQHTDRVSLLKGYIKGLRQRQEWGNLDKFELLTHALNEFDLAQERHRLARELL